MTVEYWYGTGINERRGADASRDGTFDVPVCSECGEQTVQRPHSICTCPTMIVIPPGQHIHHTCPLHGHVKVCGQYIIWCV